MIRQMLPFLLFVAAASAAHLEKAGPAPAEPSAAAERTVPSPRADGKVHVLVIPVRDEIADPVLFILRRGLKSAGRNDLVVLDMKTPGGALGTTLEIAEALQKFEGRKATYVNDEAFSAGALIASMTDDIYFFPGGVMGAAAAVSSSGQDIEHTMRLKVNSAVLAKVRAWAEGKGRYRGQVVSAMVDEDFEFKIGDTVIKPKGSLLSVYSTEAAKTYGDPPEPLLSSGTAKTIEELLDRKLGPGSYVVERLEVTWSEQLAQLLHQIAPILTGLGLLCIFIEFKLPGSMVFGVVGGVLLLLVFFSSYVAGLSGHEPVLVFALGLLLVLVELIFFPGVVAVALTGVVLMLGSLVWSMADLWPNEPMTFSGDVFVGPLTNLGVGVLIAVALGAVLARFLPHGLFFNRLAVTHGASGSAQLAGAAPEVGARVASLIGARGLAVTGLFPSGQVEIDGRRYEARVEVGAVPVGTPVVVVRVSDFGLVVEGVAS